MDLSSAHTRQIDRIRRDWLTRAWSTDRCDRETVAQQVRRLYRAAGLGSPDIVWCESPQHLAVTLDIVTSISTPGVQQLLQSRWAVPHLHSVLQGAFPLSHCSGVAHRVWEDPGRLCGDQPVPWVVRGEVDAALCANSRLNQVAEQGRQIWERSAQAVGWSAEVSVLHTTAVVEQAVLWESYLRVTGLDDPVIEATLDVLRGVGAFAPLEHLVLVCERPRLIHFNQQGDLHAQGQPAIVWADYSWLNYWNGEALPADFWDWTAERLILCDNLVWRRIGAEHIGWTPIVESLQAIAVADDPANPGQVIELHAFNVAHDLPLQRDKEVRFVRVTNATKEVDGTRRSFVIQVPPWCKDPVAAVAQSFGVSAATYRQLARAT